MSGLEVLGGISATIAIIDAALKIYHAIGHSPKISEEVAQRLPLIRDTLRSVQAGVQRARASPLEDANAGVSADARSAVMLVVESCRGKAERLTAILLEVAAQADASPMERVRTAARRLSREKQMQELGKGMLEDVQLLAANYVVQPVKDGDKAEAERRTCEIVEATQALSKARVLEPSLLGGSGLPGGSGARHMFTYTGTGDQITNSGSGQLNINKGDGTSYNAHSMSFGSR